MLNKKKFDEMRKELENFDNEREKAIDLSRKIIKESKLVIYALLRDKIEEASKYVKTIKELVKKLPDNDADTGMTQTARQEYVEAMTLYYYLKEKKFVYKDDLNVSSYDYLLGLCDLTGELMRKAVNHIIKGKVDEAEKIRNLVDEIYHEFLKMNLRNGELRKKSDQIKWNLEKLENMMYDINIKRG
ncbi:MAG: hypothetical protein ACMXYG_01330 [Candidatus Woesearchaeota archaeon]